MIKVQCLQKHGYAIQVLRLLYYLVKFGYYMDSEDVENLLPPLLNLLDGRHDYPFPAGEKGCRILFLYIRDLT